MSAITLNSNKVQIFPFANRGLKNGKQIDPEARLNTEYNITHTGMVIDNDLRSYFISKSYTENNGIIVFVLGGYFIRLTNLSQDEYNGIIDNRHWAVIKKDTRPIASNPFGDNYVTEVIEGTDNTSDNFTALEFYTDGEFNNDFSTKDSRSGIYYLNLSATDNTQVIKATKIKSNIQDNYSQEVISYTTQYKPISQYVVDGTNDGISIGKNAKSTRADLFAIGEYNIDISGNIFEVGCGDNNKSKNAFAINKDGNAAFNGSILMSDEGQSLELKIDSVNNTVNAPNNQLILGSNTAHNGGDIYVYAKAENASPKFRLTDAEATYSLDKIILYPKSADWTSGSYSSSNKIEQTISDNKNSIVLESTNNKKIAIQTGNNSNETFIELSTSANNKVKLLGDGGIYCSDYLVIGNDNNISLNHKDGQVKAVTFYATSDARKKENIINFENENSILDLPVKRFDFIDGAKNQIGCIAQDLQKLYPELVQEDDDGYLSIQENKLVYLLLDEVKKLRKELDELKNR